MKIIRQIQYEGTEEQLRKHMAFSKPDGKHHIEPTVEIRTIYSDLQLLPEFTIPQTDKKDSSLG